MVAPLEDKLLDAPHYGWVHALSLVSLESFGHESAGPFANHFHGEMDTLTSKQTGIYGTSNSHVSTVMQLGNVEGCTLRLEVLRCCRKHCRRPLGYMLQQLGDSRLPTI